MQTKWKVIIVGVLLSTLLVSLAFAKKYKGSNEAFLGVYTQTVDEDIADAFDLDSEYGAVINFVIPDSPADEAGLSDGDVIIAFNGNKVWDEEGLKDFVEDQKPGDKITITIASDKGTEEITVTLQDRDDDDYEKHFYELNDFFGHGNRIHVAPDVDVIFSNHGSSYIGVHLQGLDDQLAEFFGVTDEGVLITKVQDDSPAEKAGLKAGDVIIEIDNEELEDYDDIRRAVNTKNEGESLEIVVLREKNRQSFTVTVEERPHVYKKGNRRSYRHYPHIAIPDIPAIPDIDKIDIDIPRIKSLKGLKDFYLFSDDHDGAYFNYEEYREAMREYKKEMKEVQKELKELQRHKGEDVRKELEKELKALRKELEELRLKVED